MSDLYKYKDLKFGFVVLCPNMNTGHLRNTISSIDIYYPDAKTVIILPSDCNKDDFDSISKLKKTYKGGKTVASMINKGMEHGFPEWNFLLFSKGWIRNRVDIKYSYFIENEMDILFPIINRKLTFDKFDINNGLFMNKKSFKEIGDFPDMNSLDLSKMIWATNAITKGCKFKGIVGGKLF